MKTFKFSRTLAAVTKALMLLTLVTLTFGTLPAEARVKSNTQVRLPNNLYLGDVDGDGSADFLQVAGNRLFVFRTNYAASGILHAYFKAPISRLIIGNFAKLAIDQVCAILTDRSFQCYYAIDSQLVEMGRAQPTFIGSNEHGIVGDFDGDGADDILVYQRSTGALRMYTYTGGKDYFTPMLNFSLGNLAGVDRINKLILAGEFGQAAGRDDLLVLDPTNGRVVRLDSATDGSGSKTFWWAFTTNTGAFRTDEQVAVANVDGSALDSIVLRSTSTGAYRLFRAAYSGGYLAPLTNVSTGQLPVTTDRGQGFFTRLKYLSSEPGGTLRNDMLFFNTTTGQVIRTDARYDGSLYTYWWAYTKGTPTYNVGWPAMQKDRWVMLLCEYSDRPFSRADMSFFNRLFTDAGVDEGGMVDYFREISYGKVDLSSSEVKGWFTMSVTWAAVKQRMDEGTWDRFDNVNACVTAATQAGVRIGDYRGVVAFTNAAEPYYGTAGYINGTNARGVSATGVDLDPHAQAVTFLAHEMLHHYGMPHSWNDLGYEYGDMWDIMSAMGVAWFAGPQWLEQIFHKDHIEQYGGGIGAARASGPEMNAPYKLRLGYLPSTRVLTLKPDPSRWQRRTVSVAAINRPEANGALIVKIPVLGDPDPNHYYTIEFRQRRGWDAGLPLDPVLIHEYRNDLSYLKTHRDPQNQLISQFLQGDVYTAIPNVIISVNEINATESTATVTVAY